MDIGGQGARPGPGGGDAGAGAALGLGFCSRGQGAGCTFQFSAMHAVCWQRVFYGLTPGVSSYRAVAPDAVWLRGTRFPPWGPLPGGLEGRGGSSHGVADRLAHHVTRMYGPANCHTNPDHRPSPIAAIASIAHRDAAAESLAECSTQGSVAKATRDTALSVSHMPRRA